jgi:endonuclease YncB( thermonuclease family)
MLPPLPPLPPLGFARLRPGHSRWSVIALSIALTTGLAAGGEWSQSRSMTARVTRVSDGDTLTVVDQRGREYRVRLTGIDAPELGQPFSQVSRSHLSRLVGAQPVRVTWEKMDRYDRLLAFVSRDGLNLNLAQVEAGLAWFYRAYEQELPQAERRRFDRVEAEARTARRGLWKDASPVPPWDYRASKREGAAARRPPEPRPDIAGSSIASQIRGNRNSGIYHLPDCPDYDRVSPRNRVPFGSEREALRQGFRKARNCPR